MLLVVYLCAMSGVRAVQGRALARRWTAGLTDSSSFSQLNVV
jgi:hypothetical protein